jgi:putative heme iron utilization protein
LTEKSDSRARVREQLRSFRDSFDNLVMATVSPDGLPEASAVPTVRGGGGEFYVYVSALSRHTANLAAHPQAAVLLVQPAGAAANPFARERLSYQCKATQVDRHSAAFEDVLQRFGAAFGDIVETLKNLPDFQLYRLTPVSGIYVRGFGQAWRLTGPGLAEPEHINPAAGRKP